MLVHSLSSFRGGRDSPGDDAVDADVVIFLVPAKVMITGGWGEDRAGWSHMEWAVPA